ncbi:hypothetical protein B0T16DRAFT_443088 [Cercophora newfieldiana]|uniref:Uncharacterized protein n=1 Tax=Cercophora newfieldiana TaxID=92897 RepID=A0AA39YGU7_9PEZI|nr:hypothetical protein B0T16DRAFT_443088 [Cercophora newfieldiana]
MAMGLLRVPVVVFWAPTECILQEGVKSSRKNPDSEGGGEQKRRRRGSPKLKDREERDGQDSLMGDFRSVIFPVEIDLGSSNGVGLGLFPTAVPVLLEHFWFQSEGNLG